MICQTRSTSVHESPTNALKYVCTSNGTRYEAYAFTYHHYATATNTVAVTVEPHSTQVVAALNMTTTEDGIEIAPPKPPAQMQKEAEQDGWFSIWHEFSWWYPWYRLHTKIHINPTMDIGFNPLLPGSETFDWNGLEFFKSLAEGVLTEIALDIGVFFDAYIFARKTSLTNPILGAVLETIKLGVQAGLMFLFDWATRGPKVLGSAIGSLLMGLLAIKVDIAKAFVDTLVRLCGWVSSAMQRLLTTLMDLLRFEQLIGRWWVDAIEIGGDFLLGGLGILRYGGWI